MKLLNKQFGTCHLIRLLAVHFLFMFIFSGNVLDAHELVSATLASDGEIIKAVGFLDFLKNGEHPRYLKGGFDPKHGGHWQIDRLIQFLDSEGVTFSDVNKDTTWHAAIPAIRSELRKRSGPIFTMLVHLGHIYGQPYPQYSNLKFERSDKTLMVLVSHWYRLAFIKNHESLRLTKIEYLMLENE